MTLGPGGSSSASSSGLGFRHQPEELGGPVGTKTVFSAIIVSTSKMTGRNLKYDVQLPLEVESGAAGTDLGMSDMSSSRTCGKDHFYLDANTISQIKNSQICSTISEQ